VEEVLEGQEERVRRPGLEVEVMPEMWVEKEEPVG